VKILVPEFPRLACWKGFVPFHDSIGGSEKKDYKRYIVFVLDTYWGILVGILVA
jgi:hypothetical protein